MKAKFKLDNANLGLTTDVSPSMSCYVMVSGHYNRVKEIQMLM